MGNQAGKEGGGVDGRAGDNFGGYSETRTAPGAPVAFTDTAFATPTLGEDGVLQYRTGLTGGEGSGQGEMDLEHKDDMDVTTEQEEEDVVPTVLRWEHGGRQVFITGTFNNWERSIPMHRSGNDFTYIHDLKKGKHAFKFVVDDEWRFAPDQPTVSDVEGRVNNFIDVSDFKPFTGDDDFDFNSSKTEKDGMYSQSTPDLDEYTKEPPPLPPHLRHIILNKNPPANDPTALPVPQHVALNHLYCTAIKDGMMVLGMTQRYKQKFVATVYYSTMPG